ncbi:hypothetical protein Y1Q_0011788 [Alligator mississippiensis]|uniref:Uncharacterized protein n=1 Tax=Alligator mississippiensis TaxID=8496 RepID=A0A151M147_ALLMI|nr:hypothetical protein Y1Q_0011788 [Alligator mississippiensis]
MAGMDLTVQTADPSSVRSSELAWDASREIRAAKSALPKPVKAQIAERSTLQGVASEKACFSLPFLVGPRRRVSYQEQPRQEQQ